MKMVRVRGLDRIVSERGSTSAFERWMSKHELVGTALCTCVDNAVATIGPSPHSIAFFGIVCNHQTNKQTNKRFKVGCVWPRVINVG
jgi:hypothetical protein